MVGNTTYMFTIQVNGATATATLNNVTQTASQASNMFDQLSGSIRKMGECAFAFNNINQGLQALSSKLDNSIEPGVALNSSLADLSAVTGQTGKGLQEIEQYARKAAKTFGGSAADSAEAYKLVLSQLGPEIAKVPKALALMGSNIQTTSKTMGGDTKAAAEVLTTAMNQFQVSLADPMKAAEEMGKMMNIMAAAAKAGSAELPAIKAALEQSGMAAKMAGVSFAETNAAIQVLDKAGKKGSEGGVALRNVMATLSQGRFLPKDVLQELAAAGVNVDSLTDKTLTLSQRLKPLQGIMNDDALITKLFGKENSNAALALLSGLNAMDQYTAGIQDTNTAVEQAEVIMGSYAEKMSRQKAFVDDLKITLFNFTGAIMPYVKGVVTFFQGTASVMMGVNAMACFSESAWAIAIKARAKALMNSTKAVFASVTSMGFYNALTLASVGTTYAFSYALRAVGKAIYAIPIIGWVAAGISLLITAFKILWDKCEGFRRILFAAWEVVKAVFYNIGVVVKSLWDNMLKPYFMFWWNLVKTVASGIWSALKWCWDGIVTGLSAVGNFFVSLWDGVMTGVSAVGDFFSGIWDRLSETCGTVTEYISKAFSWIVEPIRKVFSGIWDFFSGIWNKITGALGKFFGWIGKMWNKLFPKEQFKDIGEAAEKGLAKGSESFRKSQEQKKKQEQAVTVPEIAGNNEQKVVPKTYKSSTKQGKTDKTKVEKVDLNNVKGSTDYGAIASKMSTVKISGLSSTKQITSKPSIIPATAQQQEKLPRTPAVSGTEKPLKLEVQKEKTDYLREISLNVRKAAAGIALLTSLSAATFASPVTGEKPAPVIPSTFSVQMPMAKPVISPAAPVNPVMNIQAPERLKGERAENTTQASIRPRNERTDKKVQFGKFCDQVVINVPAGTPKENVDFILRELMKKLNGNIDEI